jgi:predicted RNA binding protein YcfA (HicA-like mRNA interferase family)
MSRRFPVYNAKEVVKILRRHGFVCIAQSFSHRFFIWNGPGNDDEHLP